MPATRLGTADSGRRGTVIEVSWYADSDGLASAYLGDLDTVIERVVHEKTTLSGATDQHGVAIYDDYGAVMHEDASIDDNDELSSPAAVAMGQAMSAPLVACGPCYARVTCETAGDSGTFYLHCRDELSWPGRTE